MARIRKLLMAAFGMIALPIWPVSQADGKPSRKTGPNLIEENEIFFVTNQKKPIDSLPL